MTTPQLSVIVTVVDGGAALRRCLLGLLRQEGGPSMEILVPFDSTTTAVASLVEEVLRAEPSGTADTTIRPVDLGRLVTQYPPSTVSGQHELFDLRRARGLAAATAPLVAILEDRGVPEAGWAACLVRLHARHAHLVIGGAVENGRDRLLNWAVYFCDFGRYQRPFGAGPRRYVTDVNVTYKREALERTRAVWQHRYHEPLVHWALEQQGEVLFLSPEPAVHQMRDDLSVPRLLRERVAWGRLFGALRARGASRVKRLSWVTASPLVPLVVFSRFLGNQIARRAPLGRTLAVAPAVFVLMCGWAIGEAVGAATAAP